ncbi:hypothetical protein [Dethiobacter alkaliphilus]|uniref:DUF8042 domain-containing protein n=1 Tax=Dethiobacter alkaliphilus AHT 1 TaxID=555088 RepID=C0GJJ6_DETAL|nr:hypothetical protein [Dethiobacter alkaliphilus]EEG76543.1 conserved hypothetical protein [Dethiobacter alkaliphilus AHT 1]
MKIENIEVIHSILQLLPTIEEGLEYIKKQLTELRYEEALELLQDAMGGIVSIEKAVQPILQKLPENKTNFLGDNLKEKMSIVVSSYESGKNADLEKQVGEEALPAFKDWKAELERVLRPYTVS